MNRDLLRRLQHPQQDGTQQQHDGAQQQQDGAQQQHGDPQPQTVGPLQQPVQQEGAPQLLQQQQGWPILVAVTANLLLTAQVIGDGWT